MADGSKIEWTDATWNPITGCAVVSPGCTNCYAMKLAGTRLRHHPSRSGLTRSGKSGAVWTGEVRLNESWLTQPLRWEKPRMIFVCAHGDLFAENVPDEWIDKVFAVMALAPQHTFQVLTKRAARMREYLNSEGLLDRLLDRAFMIDQPDGADWAADIHCGHTRGMPLPNVWLGVSVEDQRRADERIPQLLGTPAAIRWISAEPLLGKLDISNYLPACNRFCQHGCTASGDEECHKHLDFLDWVVSGGESGAGARPMHPDWVRSLRDQCAAADVPFFFKQWGAWCEAASDLRDEEGNHITVDADSDEADDLFDPSFDRLIAVDGRLFMPASLPADTPARLVSRIGKRASGRLLDGRLHDATPMEAHYHG